MIPIFIALSLVLVMMALYLGWVYLTRRSVIREAAVNWRKLTAAAEARAEALLQASITAEEYSALLQYGYLEIPSRLYANRVYQIPRERRRVRVYEIVSNGDTAQKIRLGELCLITCDPVPAADLVLTHKWLLEAAEERYLKAANWVSDNWIGRGPVYAVVHAANGS